MYSKARRHEFGEGAHEFGEGADALRVLWCWVKTCWERRAGAVPVLHDASCPAVARAILSISHEVALFSRQRGECVSQGKKKQASNPGKYCGGIIVKVAFGMSGQRGRERSAGCRGVVAGTDYLKDVPC